MTDTQCLNWIESQGSPGMLWVARRSYTGRGYRLHQVPRAEALEWGVYRCGMTVREAIEQAVAYEMRQHHCYAGRKGPHRAPCSPVGDVYDAEVSGLCGCGCDAYSGGHCTA